MAAFERGRALVVGVGAYGDPRWDVPLAGRDARALHAALIDPEVGGYDPGRTELLLDQTATRAEVLLALRRLADRCDAESVALVSFTCHGAVGADGLYYLATGDARLTPAPDERVAQGSGLSVADLARALRDIPARQVLLIVNACFAGHLGATLGVNGIAPEFADRGVGQMLPDESGTELLATGEGRAIITAARQNQRSYFKADEAHSYFGQALLDTLRGGAGAGALGLYELYTGLYRQVTSVTTRRLGAAQEPVLTVLQNAGPFPVARPARAHGEGALSPTPPPTAAVREVPRDVVAALGTGATAIKADPGSRVTVDNRKLIDFGNATVMGGVTIGQVAGGDIINVGERDNTPDLPPDPRQQLPILRARVEAARHVDEGDRDEAAAKLGLAEKALARGDSARARRSLDEALTLLRAMNNGYITSIVRKLEALAARI